MDCKSKMIENDDSDCENVEKDYMEGWNCYYGFDVKKVKEFTMAGGGIHWWNYVVEFDINGNQVAVYIENKGGRHIQPKKMLISRFRDGLEYLKLVDTDYEPDEGDDDFIIVDC